MFGPVRLLSVAGAGALGGGLRGERTSGAGRVLPIRATWRRRRGGYLALVLLIGLIGGMAMASLAAARRTQSSFATFLASTRPSDLSLTVQGPNLAGSLERLPGVRSVEAALLSLNAFPLTRGAP